jgi:hypothetical protein
MGVRNLWVAVALLGAWAEARPTAYGLAIGNNAPPAEASELLPVLQYADDDATRYFQFFQRFTDAARLLSVLDTETQRRYPALGRIARPPSRVELTAAIDDFAARIRRDIERGDQPVVYIAFSGHGARRPDGTSFLALSDGALERQYLYDEVLGRLEPAPYDGSAADAGEIVALAGGTLVTSLYGDDPAWLADFLAAAGPTTGRLYLGSESSAAEAPGSGIALPQTLHGGPGRAGGGEELGGLVGVAFYMQRVALQGSREMVDKLSGGGEGGA